MYQSSFKVKVVLESFQRDSTIEQVRMKYQVPVSVINRWRSEFKRNAHVIFEQPSKKQKVSLGESPEYLKKVIGDLTVENAILKKALSVWD